MSKNLDGLHPTLRWKAQKLMRMAENAGINIIITQGLRSIQTQNNLYAQGRTKPGNIVTNARGGYSYHNFGLAFDFAILNPDGRTINWNTNIDLNKDGQKDWIQVARMGQSIGLEAGAFWKSFVDMPHFQLTYGLTTAQLRAGKKPPYNSDPEVRDFQTKLKSHGINVVVDGLYGNGSVNAVKEFQKKNGLKVDGLVGNVTYNAVYGTTTPTPKPSTPSSSKPEDKGYLEYNDRGDRVKAMQEYLNRVGFNVQETGYYNASTKQAVMDFQVARGLKSDGIYGKTTLAEMNKALREKWSVVSTSNTKPKEGIRMFKPSKDVLNRELIALLEKAKADKIVSSDEWKDAAQKGQLPLDDAVGLIASYLNRTHK